MTTSVGGASRPKRPGRPVVAATVLIGLIGVGWLSWSQLDEPELAASTDAEGMHVSTDTGQTTNPFVGSWGVSVGVALTFDDDRVLTGGRIRVDTPGLAPTVSFTPHDGTDEDAGYPVPLRVDGGVTVGVEATVLPTCGVEVAAVPVFEIYSTRDGDASAATATSPSSIRSDAAAVTDLPAWVSAVQEWCAKGVQAHLSAFSTTLDGGVTKVVTLYNPGPNRSTVVSPAASDGASRWERAETTVEGGAVAELTITGVDVEPDSAPPLTANGKPLPFLD